MDFQQGELVKVKSKKIAPDIVLSVEGLYYKDMRGRNLYFCKGVTQGFKTTYCFSENQMKRIVRDDRRDE